MASILFLQELKDSLIATQLFHFIHCCCCNESILIITPLSLLVEHGVTSFPVVTFCDSTLSLHLHSLPPKSLQALIKTISDEFEHHKCYLLLHFIGDFEFFITKCRPKYCRQNHGCQWDCTRLSGKKKEKKKMIKIMNYNK